MSKKIFFLLFLLFVSIDGLKILGVIPFASKSHHNIGSSIVKTLAKAGHDVTLMSGYPSKNPEPNLRDINVAKIHEIFESDMEVNPFIFGKYPAIGTVVTLSKMNADLVDLFMEDPEVQKFINRDEKFDVCIYEIFLTDALLGIADRVGCILISYTVFATVKWTDDMTGNISPTSYVPNPFYVYTDQMDFKERFWNTAFSLAEHIIYHQYHLRAQKMLYKKYFPNAKRTLDEMYHNSSIIFANTHISTSSARPQMPQMVEIAGIHLQPAKPLPSDIQEFLDSATEGVIYFSMGSFIQSKMWPEDKREAFVKAFGKLKQKVLWKYENETLPGNPGNIKIGSWFPQRDILAHPNVKLFMTHGGLLGGTEATAEGKPVLGFPIFGDQRMNMAKAVKNGYGLKINFDEVTEENVSEALKKLLTDPSYTNKAKDIAKRFSDRAMTPQESVLYWTEYAVRHQGAAHLQAAANKLNFIELHSIDVYALMALIFMVILIVDFYILKCLINLCCRKKSDKVKMN